MKTTNQHIYLTDGVIQLWHMMNCPDGAKYLGSLFNKAYNFSETKIFFTYTCLDDPDEIQNSEFPSYDMFQGKLLLCNAPEAEYMENVNVYWSGKMAEPNFVKF